MQKKWLLFLAIYVGLYFVLHTVYELPFLVNGRQWLRFLPNHYTQLLPFLLDMTLYFLFAFIPYILFCYLYPRRTAVALLLMLVSLPLLFLLCFQVEILKVKIQANWVSYQIRELLYAKDLRLRSYFLKNVVYALIYAIYAIVFFFIRYAQYKELQQKDMVIQNRQSELSFLRSQINPHFLFNSLHNIYSLMYQNAAGAQEAILGLSDLLRYMLYDASDKVPLQKEIDYIERYIALQRIRFDHTIYAPVHVTGDTMTFQIPPLLLIPFVENAFKHGDLSSTDEGVQIAIHAGTRNIYFHCRNKKGHGLKDATGGIGLQNVQRRLDILYQNRYTLKINDKDDYFTVNLEITHE